MPNSPSRRLDSLPRRPALLLLLPIDPQRGRRDAHQDGENGIGHARDDVSWGRHSCFFCFFLSSSPFLFLLFCSRNSNGERGVVSVCLSVCLFACFIFTPFYLQWEEDEQEEEESRSIANRTR